MNIGSVHPVKIEQEMREAYLDYAMSVIVARALPDARDGLKPVHRRILYAMYDMGLRADTPYKKSARIVGEVLGKYHPHGDAAVYDSMVRMAQDFSMRYVLVAGQGNFGSIDGDGPAAMRYTEARMADVCEELLVDIGKETVSFTENFDGSLTEPTVLPASIPNLLINGSSGIAVGMSTNIPPHNLNEVCEALIYMLNNWDNMDDITIQDLMKFIKGPDFPTAGLVYRHADGAEDGEDTLVSAYATGRGKITLRAKVHIEDMGRGKSRIIISELPYQTNKASLIERIASLVREGKLEGIADLRDESDRQGLRLAVELQRGVDPSPVLAQLFKLTPLQDTFSIIMLALVDNEPRILSLKQCLKVYLNHRLTVIQRRSQYDLNRARERAHILEGLLKALKNLNKTIDIIRKSDTAEIARVNLQDVLKITEIQAQAILDMQLRRLASLEHKKIDEEYQEKLKLITYLEGLLQSPVKMREVIAEELASIKQAYGDPRRTFIVDGTASSASVEDLLMPEENTWVTFTVAGKLARSFSSEAPKITADDKEPPRFILESSTNHTLYLFTASGKCATIPVQQLPQTEESGKGLFFSDLCPLSDKEEIIAVFSRPANLESGFLFLATENGDVKRIRMEDLPGMTSNVFVVMNVNDDRLGWVFQTTGRNQVILTTAQAQSIRFFEEDVRPTGLPAGGMRGIKLTEMMGETDRVVGANVAEEDAFLWLITNDGIAVCSAIQEFPSQGRAGSGVIAMRLPKQSKEIAACAVGSLDDTILILTNKHKAKSMRIKSVARVKRARPGGDIVISLRANEQIMSIVSYQTKIIVPEIEVSGEF